MDFKSLHQQEQPLLLGNVWDVPSAQVFEKLNYQALGTSSAAIANLLGYADGEQISFAEMAYVVERIMAATKLPVSVDMEAGYSNDLNTLLENLDRLNRLGAAGINLEDSQLATDRQLISPELMSQKLRAIRQHLNQHQLNIFVNVRIDTFLLHCPAKLEETIKRIRVYERAGADGIFVPGLEKFADITAVVAATPLPINVMSTPHLPDFTTLKNLGVKRISTGNYLQQAATIQLARAVQQIKTENSFNSLY